jgi:hypothetical protein
MQEIFDIPELSKHQQTLAYYFCRRSLVFTEPFPTYLVFGNNTDRKRSVSGPTNYSQKPFNQYVHIMRQLIDNTQGPPPSKVWKNPDLRETCRCRSVQLTGMFGCEFSSLEEAWWLLFIV